MNELKVSINCVESIKKLPEGIYEKVEGKNLFLSEDFKKLIEIQSGKVYYLYTNNYILPICIVKKIIFKRADLLSEYYVINDDNSESPVDFLDSCMEYIKTKFRVHFVGCTPTYSFFDIYPTKSKRIEFGSHVIDLKQSEEEIYNNMKSNCKKSLKVAQNHGLIVKKGQLDLLDDYIEMDNATRKRSNMPLLSREYYKQLLECLPSNTIIFIAYLDNEPQGGAFYFYDKNYSYSIYGASANNPVNGSSNLLYWEAMKYMKECGVSMFSFVGCRINVDQNSKYYGIQRFKASFGSEIKKGYLFKVIFNKFMYNLYNFLIFVKSGKVYKDIIDQEIHKWQDIN